MYASRVRLVVALASVIVDFSWATGRRNSTRLLPINFIGALLFSLHMCQFSESSCLGLDK